MDAFSPALTASELIDRLGGTKATAVLLGVEQNTVSNWRIRGIPAWAHVRLMRASESLGITVDPSVLDARPPGRRELGSDEAAD